jgi:hypothetical protein
MNRIYGKNLNLRSRNVNRNARRASIANMNLNKIKKKVGHKFAHI